MNLPQNAMLVYPSVANFLGFFSNIVDWLNIFCPTIGIVALMNGTIGILYIFRPKFPNRRSHINVFCLPQILLVTWKKSLTRKQNCVSFRAAVYSIKKQAPFGSSKKKN